MKRVVRLTAEDADRELTVRVEATIVSKNGLTRDEVEVQATDLVRGIARALEGVHYSDFGIDNIKVA